MIVAKIKFLCRICENNDTLFLILYSSFYNSIDVKFVYPFSAIIFRATSAKRAMFSPSFSSCKGKYQSVC
ncbi:hypothetical protein HMPREF1870_01684 [Bacteroidales bacterium KA00344]|nr:hypothetical protein HMPREF1870_01684 [Bacteroidales bacterium KA00344]